MADSGDPSARTRAILDRISAGDEHAPEELLVLAYGELRELARGAMHGRQAQTIQPTALVHEAYLKLLGPHADRNWTSKPHLLAAAAKAMRSVLVDHARRRQAEKRGGGALRIELTDTDGLTDGRGSEIDVAGLDEALTKLSALDPELGRLVELRFFAGLSLEETAQVLGVSVPTVVRSWRVARLFLQRELGPS